MSKKEETEDSINSVFTEDGTIDQTLPKGRHKAAPKKELTFYEGQKVPAFKDAVYICCIDTNKQGSFGSVHKVYDREENCYHAMKIPRSEYIKDMKARKRFMEEAKVLAALPAHRNIVKATGFYLWDTTPCLFTEYIESRTLDEIFKKQHGKAALSGESGRSFNMMPADTARDIRTLLTAFIEISRGMNFIYQEKSLIHLDLKPANVVWNREDGRLKIIDFGLSRSVSTHDGNQKDDSEDADSEVSVKSSTERDFSEDIEEESTFTRMSMETEAGKLKQGGGGTLPYMSPEHFRGFDYCDTRSDIYSMGVMMYEFASGRRPFIYTGKGNGYDEYRKMHTETEVKTVPDCDKRLEQIIIKCLRKSPVKRYDNFNELLSKLKILYKEITGQPYHDGEEIETDINDLANKSSMYANFEDYAKSLEYAEKGIALDPEHFESLFLKCHSLYRLGKIKEAYPLIEELSRRDPELHSILNLKGHIHNALGEYEKAIQCYENAKTSDFDDVICGNLSTCYISLKRYVEGQLTLNEGLRLNPDSLWLMNQQVNLHLEKAKAEQQEDARKREQEKALNFLKPKLDTDWDGSIHNLYGWALNSAERYNESIDILERYIKINPESDLVLGQLGLAYHNSEKYQKAIDFFNKVLEQTPGDATYAGNLINSYWQSDNAQEAIKFGETWLRNYEQNTTNFFWNQLGLAYNADKQYQKAIACYSMALEIKPGDGDYAGNLINSYRKAGNQEEAINFGETWLREYEQNATDFFCNQLGLAYSNNKQHDKAIECYNKALDKESGNVDYAENLIFSYRQTGNPEEAINFAEMWLKNYKQNATASFWNQLGFAYDNNNQYDKAISCYKKALDKEPGNATYSGNLISSYWQSGNSKAGIEFGENWLADYENNATDSFWNQLGALYDRDKQSHRGIECYKKALDKEPGNATYSGNLISSYWQSGNSKAGIEFGAKWRTEYEQNATDYFWNQLGLAYSNNKQHDKAIDCYNKVLKKNPEDATYAGKLISSYSQSDKAKEAINFGEQWLKNYEQNATASFWNQLGLTYNTDKQYQKAIDCYNKALEIQPGDGDCAGNLISSHHQAGNPEDAINFGETWRRNYERNATDYFWNQLGNAYYTNNQYNKAIECFKNALDKQSDNVTYAGNLIDSHNQAGDPEEAVNFGEQWLREHEQKANESFWGHLSFAYGTLMHACSQSDNVEKAIEIGKRWRINYEENIASYCWNLLGDSYSKKNDYEKAAECLQKACKKEPGNVSYARNLIVSYCQSDNAQEAIDFGERWLKEYEQNATDSFWSHLGSAYSKMKQYDKLANCTLKCLDKAPEDPISAGNLIYAYRKMGNIQESVNLGNNWKAKYQSNDYFEEQLEISINSTLLGSKRDAH